MEEPVHMRCKHLPTAVGVNPQLTVSSIRTIPNTVAGITDRRYWKPKSIASSHIMDLFEIFLFTSAILLPCGVKWVRCPFQPFSLSCTSALS